VGCARCDAPAVVIAMRTHGRKVIGKPWAACAKHAPVAGPSVELFGLGEGD